MVWAGQRGIFTRLKIALFSFWYWSLIGTFALLGIIIIIVVVVIICSPSLADRVRCFFLALAWSHFFPAVKVSQSCPKLTCTLYCTSMMGCIKIDMCLLPHLPGKKIRPHWLPVLVILKCNVAVADCRGLSSSSYPLITLLFWRCGLWG
jgi:hypothetical protein